MIFGVTANTNTAWLFFLLVYTHFCPQILVILFCNFGAVTPASIFFNPGGTKQQVVVGGKIGDISLGTDGTVAEGDMEGQKLPSLIAKCIWRNCIAQKIAPMSLKSTQPI